MGRQFAGSVVSPPLSIGVTLEIFRISDTTPWCKDWLKMEVKHSLMWLEASLIHFLGIPIVDLLRFIPIIKT